MSADVHVLFNLCFLHGFPARVAREHDHGGEGQQLLCGGADLFPPLARQGDPRCQHLKEAFQLLSPRFNSLAVRLSPTPSLSCCCTPVSAHSGSPLSGTAAPPRPFLPPQPSLRGRRSPASFPLTATAASNCCPAPHVRPPPRTRLDRRSAHAPPPPVRRLSGSGSGRSGAGSGGRRLSVGLVLGWSCEVTAAGKRWDEQGRLLPSVVCQAVLPLQPTPFRCLPRSSLSLSRRHPSALPLLRAEGILKV